MKNFEVRYPVAGTSALQPKFERPSSSAGTIVEFPGRGVAQDARKAQSPDARARILDCELVRSLRFGSASGCAYDRIAPWQAALAGIAFAAAAIFVVLLRF